MTANAAPLRSDAGLVRVYVWEWPVRVTHWLIVGSILLCSATGLYIGNPFLISSGPAGGRFIMGWARVVHFYAAIVFALAVLSRIAWMFLGNTLRALGQVHPGARRQPRAGFIRRSGSMSSCCGSRPASSGTTRSRVVTYTARLPPVLHDDRDRVRTLLRRRAVGSIMRPFQFLVPLVGGLQTARWIHHVVMWLLLGFAVHHVYSAVLMSTSKATARWSRSSPVTSSCRAWT